MTEGRNGGALEAEVTRDALLDGRLTLLQPSTGPRAAIDALFLAAAVPAVAGQGQHVLEAGTGNGVVALALARRVADVRVTGVEVQGDLCRLAAENARANALESRVHFVEADVTAPWQALERAGLAREGYDHGAANPPYHTEGRARAAASAAKQRAHAAGAEQLELWLRFLTSATRPRGTLTLIHRAEALPRLLAALERRFGGLVVFPLLPREGEAASRVIVQGVKGSRAPLRLAPGLVLHEASGAYTAAAEAVLRGGEALRLL